MSLRHWITKMRRKRWLRIVRIVWVSGGVLFLLWLAVSMQARGVDPAVLQSDGAVTVVEKSDTLQFIPRTARPTGMIFYPGALVEPTAYAPLARAVAEEGFLTIIVKLPLRSAAFGAQEADVMAATLALMAENDAIQAWFVAGHSRGGAIAARFAHAHAAAVDGLILIGTSHPKEEAFSLAGAAFPVLQIVGTNDGLASMAEVAANARFLPPESRRIEIAGGNHAQFGYYGFQLGDNRAEISRDEQQALTVAAIREALFGAR